MKNLWNWVTLTLGRISLMTRVQQLILIGSIILPGGSLILIFSRLGQQIIRKQEKKKIMKIYGNKHKQQKEDLK
jgi:hypothetical protein